MGDAVSVRLAEERIAVLKADPEFKRLDEMVPRKLRGKTWGEDMEVITTDAECEKRSGNKKVATLTDAEHRSYRKLDQACQRLAEKYGLAWHTVFDLAVGGKPIVRLEKEISAYLNPLVFGPRDLEVGKHYVACHSYSTPLEVIEIMKRVQSLDEQTKMEIRGYLQMLAERMPGCSILELIEGDPPGSPTERRPQIHVHLVVPPGYTSRDVAAVYRKIDDKRRQYLIALGHPIAKRRRTSKVLEQAERLRIHEDRPSSYDIVDEVYRDQDVGNIDLSQDQPRRRRIVVQRSRARKLMRKRLT